MRFARYQDFPFVRTKLKDAAFLRKQRREAESLPLFADQVREAQSREPGLEQRMATRAENWEKEQRADRRRHAERWIEARRRLNAMPEPLRTQTRAYWQTCSYPADPTYLASLVHTRLKESARQEAA